MMIAYLRLSARAQWRRNLSSISFRTGGINRPTTLLGVWCQLRFRLFEQSVWWFLGSCWRELLEGLHRQEPFSAHVFEDLPEHEFLLGPRETGFFLSHLHRTATQSGLYHSISGRRRHMDNDRKCWWLKAGTWLSSASNSAECWSGSWQERHHMAPRSAENGTRRCIAET